MSRVLVAGGCGFIGSHLVDRLLLRRDVSALYVVDNLWTGLRQNLGKGFELLLYDKHVNLAALTGANKDYILNHIPHISRLIVDSVEKVTDFAETIVVGNEADEFRDDLGRLREDQVVIDLARISGKTSDRQYQGICW